MKVSELEGVDLDYWVAKALRNEPLNGSPYYIIVTHPFSPSKGLESFSDTFTHRRFVLRRNPETALSFVEKREMQTGEPFLKGAAKVCLYDPAPENDGNDPLLRAMRALVASVYGEEVGDG